MMTERVDMVTGGIICKIKDNIIKSKSLGIEVMIESLQKVDV